MPVPMRRRWGVLPGSYEDSPVERSRQDLREAVFEYTAWGNRRPADPLAFKMLEAASGLLSDLEDLAGEPRGMDGCLLEEHEEEPPRETAPIRVTAWGFFRKAPWRVKVGIVRAGARWAWRSSRWWAGRVLLEVGCVVGGLAIARLLGVIP